MAERRRRGWLWFVVALVIIIPLLWIAYWFAARYVADTAIRRLAANDVAVCADPALGGFPFNLDIGCESLTHRSAAEQLTFDLGRIRATAPLYRPGIVEAALEGQFTIAAPSAGLALDASWSDATVRASAWLGGLTGVAASFTELHVNNASTGQTVPVGGITAASLNAEVTPAPDQSFAASIDARDLVIFRADDTAFPAIDVDGRLILEDVGGALGTDPAETLLTWARGTPSVGIEKIRIASEDTVVAADGTLSLSADGLLNGSVLFRWNNVSRLADLVEAILPGTRRRAAIALQALNAVSVSVETPDGPMRQTALTFTNGVIWLGILPLPIDPIPPIRF